MEEFNTFKLTKTCLAIENVTIDLKHDQDNNKTSNAANDLLALEINWNLEVFKLISIQT